MINASRKFKDPQILNMMLRLRFAGWTYTSLATLFKCDHSSIYNQCQSHFIFPFAMIKVNIAQEIKMQIFGQSQPVKEDKWYIMDGEKINKGKSYAEYLKDAGLKRSTTNDRWTIKFGDNRKFENICRRTNEETF